MIIYYSLFVLYLNHKRSLKSKIAASRHINYAFRRVRVRILQRESPHRALPAPSSSSQTLLILSMLEDGRRSAVTCAITLLKEGLLRVSRGCST